VTGLCPLTPCTASRKMAGLGCVSENTAPLTIERIDGPFTSPAHAGRWIVRDPVDVPGAECIPPRNFFLYVFTMK
jgi:hypothetical protein